MPTPLPPRQNKTLCEVDDCCGLISYMVRTTDALTGLCDYHYKQTLEFFPNAIFLEKNGSRTDWHDRVYHEGVPATILNSRATPERSRRYF